MKLSNLFLTVFLTFLPAWATIASEEIINSFYFTGIDFKSLASDSGGNSNPFLVTLKNKNIVAADAIAASVSTNACSSIFSCPTLTETTQWFCRSTWPGNEVSHLQAVDNGTGIAWYPDNISTVALNPGTDMDDGDIFYLGSPDASCAGNRPPVTVRFLPTPNAGKTSFITLDSNGPTVDLRDLITQTEPDWPVDSGGYMSPTTKTGGTIFTPALDELDR